MNDSEYVPSLFTNACHLLFDCDTLEQQSQGLVLLEKAAEQNDPSALCLLGDFYLYGKKGFVAKDVKKSTSCYFSAWNLISSYFIEEDTPDSAESQNSLSVPINWHHAAKVCFCMGTVFLYGRCYVEDYNLAEMFFQNACYGYNILKNENIPGAEKKLTKAHYLLLEARSRRSQLTHPIHIYDKATLKDKPFTIYPFHAVHRSIIDVYNADVNRFLCEQTGIPYTRENESFFYCYVDETYGLTLRALGFFNHSCGKTTYQIIPESSPILFRYASFKEWSVSLGTIPEKLYRHHRELCQSIMENYEANPTIMKACLDALRSNEFPYDIQAILTSPTERSELVWYRPIEMNQFTLKGILLNEPHGDFGIHQGSSVYGQLSFPDGNAAVFIYGFSSASEPKEFQNNTFS